MNFRFVVSRGIIAITAICCVANAEAQEAGKSDVESTIRQSAKEFSEAFDRGDAKAIADLFTEDAVYVSEDGQRFEGRDAIQKEYEAWFKLSSDLKLKVEIDSIRPINSTTALEEGRLALTPQPPGSNRVMSSYSAVHTLQGGKWLMAYVRDVREELPPDFGQLEDLSWMIGTWSASNGDSRVELKCRWIEQNQFLARTHTVTEAGKVTMTGLEVIGVDAPTGQITSWSFSSDGGFANGLWAPFEQGWVTESSGFTKDGTETIATNLLTMKDKDTLVWDSTDRWLGEDTLPDLQGVMLKRQ